MPDKQARNFFGLDGGEPWFVKYGKNIWNAAVSNPLTVVLLFGMWLTYVEITHSRARAAEGQKFIMDRQAEIEDRREKWAERHSGLYLQSFGQLGQEINRLRETVDRNTDAIRGKVFTPKAPAKKLEP
jgi:hypothetical protein